MPLTIVAKSSIVDIWQDPKYISETPMDKC